LSDCNFRPKIRWLDYLIWCMDQWNPEKLKYQSLMPHQCCHLHFPLYSSVLNVYFWWIFCMYSFYSTHKWMFSTNWIGKCDHFEVVSNKQLYYAFYTYPRSHAKFGPKVDEVLDATAHNVSNNFSTMYSCISPLDLTLNPNITCM
jgi:hypothetical protein